MGGRGLLSDPRRVGTVLPGAILALTGLALALLLLLPASDEEATTTSSPTGIPEVDAIIDAVERQDVDALRGFVRYRRMSCRPATENDYIAPPACPEGFPQGAAVDVFMAGSCHPRLVTAAEVADAIGWVGDDRLTTQAVFRGGEPFAEIEADYRVVLGSPSEPDQSRSSQLGISGGGVVWLTGWCDSALRQIEYLQEIGAELIYLAPESSAIAPAVAEAVAPEWG